MKIIRAIPHKSFVALFIVVFGIVVGFGVLFFSQQSTPTDIFSETADTFDSSLGEMGTYNVTEDGLYLYVPLDETVEQRAQLMVELKNRTSYYLRDIYEKYIDLVGANGLITSVHTVYPTCHSRGHDLGKVISAKLGSVGAALRTCQDACFSGCMHGVLMDRLAIEKPDQPKQKEDELGLGVHVSITDVEKQIVTICDDPGLSDIYKFGDCVHGVGHALMFLVNYDIPKALEYCSLFESDPVDYYCSTGAYMEYVTNYDQQDSVAKPIFYPCDQNEYPAACFRYKLPYFSFRHYGQGRSLGDIINSCKALEGKYRLGCFHGLGNTHMYLIAFSKIDFAAVCGSGTEDDQYMCIEGAIERMAKYYPVAAKERCDDFSGWQKDLCLEGASRGMYSLEKSFDLYLLDE